MVLTQMVRDWWMLLIRGIVAVVFGILALVWPPGITFLALTLLFGAYALVDGVFAIAAAVRRIQHRAPSGWLLLEGIAGILAGILAFLFTGIAAVALLFLIGAWAIVTGVFEFVQAVELRRAIANVWLLLLSGAASVIFGVLIFFFPSAGLVAVVWLVGIYAIIFGVLLIALSLRLRSLRERLPESSERMTPAY